MLTAIGSRQVDVGIGIVTRRWWRELRLEEQAFVRHLAGACAAVCLFDGGMAELNVDGQCVVVDDESPFGTVKAVGADQWLSDEDRECGVRRVEESPLSDSLHPPLVKCGSLSPVV